MVLKQIKVTEEVIERLKLIEGKTMSDKVEWLLNHLTGNPIGNPVDSGNPIEVSGNPVSNPNQMSMEEMQKHIEWIENKLLVQFKWFYSPK